MLPYDTNKWKQNKFKSAENLQSNSFKQALHQIQLWSLNRTQNPCRKLRVLRDQVTFLLASSASKLRDCLMLWYSPGGSGIEEASKWNLISWRILKCVSHTTTPQNNFLTESFPVRPWVNCASIARWQLSKGGFQKEVFVLDSFILSKMRRCRGFIGPGSERKEWSGRERLEIN